MGNSESSSSATTKVITVAAIAGAAALGLGVSTSVFDDGQKEQTTTTRTTQSATQDADMDRRPEPAIQDADERMRMMMKKKDKSAATSSFTPAVEGYPNRIPQNPEPYFSYRQHQEGSRSEKLKRKEVGTSAVLGRHVDPRSNKGTFKILSYNVWFREDLELHERMKALGELIRQHSPDVICLQEVTPDIYEIFQNSNWWKNYRCSVSQELANSRRYFCMQMSKLPVKSFKRRPFTNSVMGRELCIADIDIGMDKKLVIATSHLESPSPAPPRWDQMYSKERVAQAKESVELLKDFPNVIFGGDMNWDDELDGAFPLNNGWVDAWVQLRAGENGFTYDTKSNQMLTGNRTLQKRLDRFLCNMKDFKIDKIDMIGKDAIPGISYRKEKKVGKQVKQLVLPVLPSDHYGLLLTIRSI